MDIPGGNDIRVKGRTVQDRIKVGSDSSVKKGGGGSSASTPTSDTTAISPQAAAIQQAVDTVKNAQDVVRQEKVDQIKDALAKGTFKIDTLKVAEKLLEEAIRESEFLE